MTNTEFKNFLLNLQSGLRAEIKAQADVTDKVVIVKLNELIEHVKETNGRVRESEKNITDLQMQVAEGDNKCLFIQDEKNKKVIRNRWAIGTLLVIIGLLSGMFYKVKEKQEVPIELIYRKTDSTYAIPNMYFRRPGDQEFFEVNKVYVDIKDEK